MNVLTLEGCYLLHSPGGACYATHMRGVVMSLTVVLVLSLFFVCLLQVFMNVLTLEGYYLLHGPFTCIQTGNVRKGGAILIDSIFNI